MLDYVKGLKYDENPDYQLLYSLILEINKENCSEDLYKFEWNKKIYYPNTKYDGITDRTQIQTNSMLINNGNYSNNLIEKDDSAINVNGKNSILRM